MYDQQDLGPLIRLRHEEALREAQTQRLAKQRRVTFAKDPATRATLVAYKQLGLMAT